MSTYEDALKQMHEDERRSGIVGCGEIIDEGRLGKSTLRAMMERELAECTLDKLTEAANEWRSFLPGLADTPTDESVAAMRAEISAKYDALIAAAPEEDEHDYVYYP